MTEPPRLWPVLVVYVGAFAAIVAFSLVAAAAVRSLYPDLPETTVLEGLPGLLAGGVASSLALALTTLLASRPFEPARLRLLPGSETGRMLTVMVVGTLALGQTLDSLTTLVGLGQHGSLPMIRRALAGAVGAELFAAVVVIGVMAGTAEEMFFRGYLQTALRARWRPGVAVLVTSLAFALLHLEWLHAALALLLGLYLGFVTELAGSALPAVVCHVVNNIVFTLLTARVGAVEAFWPNVVLLGASAAVLAACVLWLRARPATPPLQGGGKGR